MAIIQNVVSGMAPPSTPHLDGFNPLKRDIFTALRPLLSQEAEIYTQESPEWTNETSRWSTYKQPSFTHVVVPATEKDVSVTVQYTVDNDIPLFTQGGGHGFSTTFGGVRDAVMIRMRRFDYAIIDNAANTVRVGGGTPYSTLIPELYNAGRELPVGLSPCPGAVGVTLGGGHGRLQGKHGLMIDAVASMRVVLASGKCVTASATENPDLFYAMKGAGQQFGVVVEVVYNTYSASSGGNFYNVDMIFGGEKLEDILGLINGIIPGQSAELALVLVIINIDLVPAVMVNLVYAGTKDAGRIFSKKFNDTGPNSFTESMISYADLPTKSGGGGFSAACQSGLKENNYSLNLKSFDIPTIRRAFNRYGDYVQANPTGAHSGWLVEVFPHQGIDAVPSSSASYPNRGKCNILAIFSGTYTDELITDATDAYLRDVRGMVSETSGYEKLHVYQNYARGDEPFGAIYGYDDRKFEELRRLKAKFDPGNIFRGYHDIPLPTA